MSGLRSNESSVVPGPWGQRDESELEEAAAELEADKKAANENTATDVAPHRPAVQVDPALERFVRKVWDQAERAIAKRYSALFASYDELVEGHRKVAMRLALTNRGLRRALAVVASVAVIEAIVLMFR
jgi:hypothetical protein